MADSRLISGRVVTFLFLLFALLPGALRAADPPPATTVYLFWAQDCPYCEREIAFLRRLKAAHPIFPFPSSP